MTGIVAAARDFVIPLVETYTKENSKSQIEDCKHSYQHKSWEELPRIYCRCRSESSAIGDTNPLANVRDPSLKCLGRAIYLVRFIVS